MVYGSKLHRILLRSQLLLFGVRSPQQIMPTFLLCGMFGTRLTLSIVDMAGFFEVVYIVGINLGTQLPYCM